LLKNRQLKIGNDCNVPEFYTQSSELHKSSFIPVWLPSAVLENKYEKIFYFSKKSVDGLPI